MKYLYGYFNSEKGKSIVALADKYGSYVGEAKVHPDDKDYASEFMGCSLAQQRALINALQNKNYRLSIQLRTIQTLNNEIKKYCNFIPKNVQRRINLKIRDFSKEIKENQQEIENIKKDILSRIQIRDKIIKKIKQSK